MRQIPRRKKVSQPILNCLSGVLRIKQTHPTRKAWQEALKKEINSIRSMTDGIKSEFKDSVNLVEDRSTTLLVRQTLIKNNFGNISQEKVDNQEAWHKYVGRLVIAQEYVSTGLNWLNLLLENWNEQHDAVREFWDKFEDRDYDDRQLASIAKAVVLLIRRHDFLHRRFEAMIPRFDALFEGMPAWIEW